MKPIKKRRKKGESTIVQEKLWKLCKEYIRKKYGNTCYTCGAEGLVGSNWQTGHYIPKGFLPPYLKYDPRVLRPQCMRCNMHLGGMGAMYHINIVAEMGHIHVRDIHYDMEVHNKDKMKPKEALTHYKNMVLWYTSN